MHKKHSNQLKSNPSDFYSGVIGIFQFLLAIAGSIGCLALIGWITTIPDGLHTLKFKHITATLLSVLYPHCAKSWGSQDLDHILTFQYRINEIVHTSHQVSGSWGGLGFTSDCGQKFYQSLVPLSSVTAYVNPSDPAQAVLVRGVIPPSHFYFNFSCIILLLILRKLDGLRLLRI